MNKPFRSGFLTLAAFVFIWMFASQSSAQSDLGTTPKPSGGKVTVCKEIDDDWKCVGESAQWPANQPFDILFKNADPVGVGFLGIVLHKQGPDGKDVDFINEYQVSMDPKNRWYATERGMFKLPAGVYSIYIIRWDKRELMTHHGNFKEYFAKATLTVK